MHQTSTRLADVLSPEFIHPALHATRGDAVVRELARLLADSYEAVDEQEVTTYFSNGNGKARRPSARESPSPMRNFIQPRR